MTKLPSGRRTVDTAARVAVAKAVVVGMTFNGVILADPNDRSMLDMVGFDTAVPAVIADFVRR